MKYIHRFSNLASAISKEVVSPSVVTIKENDKVLYIPEGTGSVVLASDGDDFVTYGSKSLDSDKLDIENTEINTELD